MPTKDKKIKHEKKTTKNEIQEPIPEPEIIEKIVYKKQRVHGFFRTLTILVLLVIGFLLLGESMGIAKVTIGDFALDTVYPIFVIFSTIVIRSYRNVFGKLFGLILFLGVFGGFFTIRIYNGLDEQTPAKFGQQIAFEITGSKKENITIKTLVSDMEIEGNTKSPYLQGTRTSDRDMLSSKTTTGNQETLLIQDETTLNLLQDFISQIVLFVPAKTDFGNIYIRNARGTENINTQNITRRKMTLHGGINRISLDINNVPDKAEIEIQGAIQDITINIPREIGVIMQYKNKIGYKTTTDIDYKTGYLYASTNIDTAKKVLTLNINTLIGRLKINWK